jgi:oligoribonuclease NrnB/cAMP/cGMP phosphodiesterase (DHH superfamily)
LGEQGKSFTWIDHHKTAIDDAAKAEFNPAGRRQIGKAACTLCWEYLFKEQAVPWGVELLGLYDVFKLENPQVEQFQFGMRGEPTGIGEPIWKSVMASEPMFITRTCYRGAIVKKHWDLQNAGLSKAVSFPIELAGLKVLAANAHGNSQFFTQALKNGEYDAAVLFYYAKATWKVSIFAAKEGVDVSAVAKKFGGGGHAGAAGWSSKTLPFELP